MYYGTEQPALAGLADQRTSMFGHTSTNTSMYAFLSKINSIRRTMGFGHGGADAQTEAVVVPTLVPDHHVLVFVRGGIVALLSNHGHAREELDPGRNPPHTRISCVSSQNLGSRWSQVCPGDGSTICAGVQSLLGQKATCTCRDDKAQMCLSTQGGKPGVFGLSKQAS